VTKPCAGGIKNPMTIPAAIQIPIKQLKSTRQQSIINGAALSLQTAQCFVEVRL